MSQGRVGHRVGGLAEAAPPGRSAHQLKPPAKKRAEGGSALAQPGGSVVFQRLGRVNQAHFYAFPRLPPSVIPSTEGGTVAHAAGHRGDSLHHGFRLCKLHVSNQLPSSRTCGSPRRDDHTGRERWVLPHHAGFASGAMNPLPPGRGRIAVRDGRREGGFLEQQQGRGASPATQTRYDDHRTLPWSG